MRVHKLARVGKARTIIFMYNNRVWNLELITWHVDGRLL